MNTRIFLLIIIGCIAIVSCNKKNDVQPKSTSQLVSKIVMTTGAGSNSISYAYNDAGKLIAEGSVTYVRDDKQRIIQILDPETSTNRKDIAVYYTDNTSNKVAYTFCYLDKNLGTDSTVYIHDDAGKLVKTMNYFHQFAGQYWNDTTFLAHYDIFQYDDAGNLIQTDNYNITLGSTSHCGEQIFTNYLQTKNPLYTDDEVRTMNYAWEGVLNTAAHNFTTFGSYLKKYSYREDGLPLSCIVSQPNTTDFILTFEYK